MPANTTPHPDHPDRPALDETPPSTPPAAPADGPVDLTVSVDGDNVLVEGTTRSDTDAIQALKAAGFRWFRSLGCWGLPRSFRPETRIARLDQFVELMARLDRTVTIEDSGTDMDAADRRAARDQRLSDRADTLAERAERNTATADSARAAAERIYSQYRLVKREWCSFGVCLVLDRPSR